MPLTLFPKKHNLPKTNYRKELTRQKKKRSGGKEIQKHKNKS